MNAAGRVSDRGSAGVEVALSVTALLLVGFFTIGALRTTNTTGDVQAAAHAGARAAASARAADEGVAAAQAVVASALGNRGVACADLEVAANRSGDVATVNVTCTVVLSDVSPAGFDGPKTITASASERVDPLRGGGQ